MKQFYLIVFLFLLSVPTVFAADTTPPLLVMYLGADDSMVHHDKSFTFTIYARLWNRDDESDVTSCEVDWGEGVGWESITKGNEGQYSNVPHTYQTNGLKTVKYRCISEGGTTSGNVQHVDWDSIEILASQADTTPPLAVMWLAQVPDLSVHNDLSNSFIIYAKLWNRDDESDVTSCEIDWGEGVGWESITKGNEGQFSVVGHTYITIGLKRVDYRCISEGGVSGTGVQHQSWDSIEITEKAIVVKPKSQQESFHLSRIVPHQNCGTPGGMVSYSGVFDDALDAGIEEFHFMVSIPELGIKSPRKSFNLKDGSSARIFIELPENINDGEYYSRFDMSNDKFRRVTYRPLLITESC